MLKVLLIGPFPPPHGGVSVHVSTLQRLLVQTGVPCRVLNLDREAPRSDRYIAGRGPLRLMLLLTRYSLKGWSFHAHINGHNLKSWLVAFGVGVAGAAGPAAILTIHSGMAPQYLSGRRLGRLLARMTSRLYRHIIAVNSEIKDALATLSVPESHIEMFPAFFAPSRPRPSLPDGLESWSRDHDPILSTALCFRPEYAFGVLVQAVSALRHRHPRVGCIVMGDSESRAEGESIIRDQELQNHMLAIGDVTHDRCLAVIARSNVFVRATLFDGDATSVREAIDLGTPVVASDVVRRPEGTLCFKTGDANDLASKIDHLLSRAVAHPRVPPDSGGNCIPRLLTLYGASAGQPGGTAGSRLPHFNNDD